MYVTCRKSGLPLALLLGGGSCKCQHERDCALEKDAASYPIGSKFYTSLGEAEVIGVYGDARWVKYEGDRLFETLSLEHMERRVYHGSLVPMAADYIKKGGG